MAFNQNLLGTICVENKIADVLRKLQSLPVVAVQDIREAYYRLRMGENSDKTDGRHSSAGPLAILMDCDTGADRVQTLTAKKTTTSKLVAILVMVAVMGISQSGLLLSLAKSGLGFQDETLDFLIRELSYADDLHSGVTAQEVMDLQRELFPSIPWQKMKKSCNDEMCCPPSITKPTTASWTPPPPTGRTAPGGWPPTPERTSTRGCAPAPGRVWSGPQERGARRPQEGGWSGPQERIGSRPQEGG
jgi:hypothetical protein